MKNFIDSSLFKVVGSGLRLSFLCAESLNSKCKKVFYVPLDKLSKRAGPIDIMVNISINRSIAKEFAYIRLTCFLFCNQVDSAKGKDQNSPPNAPNSAIVGISSRSPLPPKTGPSTGMKKVKQEMQCKAVAEKMG